MRRWQSKSILVAFDDRRFSEGGVATLFSIKSLMTFLLLFLFFYRDIWRPEPSMRYPDRPSQRSAIQPSARPLGCLVCKRSRDFRRNGPDAQLIFIQAAPRNRGVAETMTFRLQWPARGGVINSASGGSGSDLYRSAIRRDGVPSDHGQVDQITRGPQGEAHRHKSLCILFSLRRRIRA